MNIITTKKDLEYNPIAIKNMKRNRKKSKNIPFYFINSV